MGRPTMEGLAPDGGNSRQAPEKNAAPPNTPAAAVRMPVSFAQERMWILDQLESDHPVYNMSRQISLQGPLDISALERSLEEIVRRHEVMRTTFELVDGKPVQVIHNEWQPKLNVEELKSVAPAEVKTTVERLAQEEARRTFSLAKAPGLRVRLLRLSDQEHLLLLTMHHIASDGWSLSMFYRELKRLYEAFHQGRPSPLPELAIQYADYAIWQREWLQGKVLEELLGYWRNKLEGAPAALELPGDCVRPAVQRYRGKLYRFELPADLSANLKVLAHREGVTLFMMMLAAFKVLLYRYTGQTDIVIGFPIAGRTRVELEPLIGFFVNTLVLRTELSGNPSFRLLLARVRQVCLEAYEHQDLPFEKLVEELNPRRSTNSHPLFQIMFAFQNPPAAIDKLSDVTFHVSETHAGAAKFDLALNLEGSESKLRGVLEYDTDLFAPDRITRLADHYTRILDEVVVDPDRRIEELPLMDDNQMQQVLVEWNDTHACYPDRVCVQELIEAQVERVSDAVAIVQGEVQLTYRELNTKANQLAHRLKRLGVGPEVMVGICMKQSVDMVVALLAVLKAGGAYVPVDPSYPKDWAELIEADTEFPVILSHQRLAERLSPSRAGILWVDTDWKAIESEDRSNPYCDVRPENLAYVIYTSGSTGMPKGVMIEHGSLVNYLFWVNGSLLNDTSLIMPAVTKLTFDASVKQLIAPLARGGEVWILSENVAGQPAELLNILGSRTKVGLNCVPSLWEPILDLMERKGESKVAGGLTDLFLGGDVVSRSLVERSLKTVPGLRIWNLYGPTETTANSTMARISSESRVTIGSPIANTQIYILDPHHQPVPVGIPGEMYIGGRGLGRGYLKRPDLTAEKFVPSFFSGDGLRLYKSGDIAGYLPDGSIEFIGRIDHQAKIRGFRVELDEIAESLKRNASVEQAVVALDENETGDKRVVAYLVPKRGHTIEAAALRTFLKNEVPDYMIPEAFVFLEALPLTPNGKVDRSRLPKPDRQLQSSAKYVAPRTVDEEMLTEIWIEVLKVRQVGIHDNFFELGGHSLTAAQIISRANDAFGINLPLRVAFEAPTVAELGREVESAKKGGTSPQPPPIGRASRSSKP